VKQGNQAILNYFRERADGVESFVRSQVQ
jgi:hypothetical protein